MSHSHAHHHNKFNKIFAISVFANLAYVFIQAGYAVYANSMSLLADAVHNLGDVLGLAMAWVAHWLISHPPNEKFTYGYRKTSIIAALANALILIGSCAIIGYESFRSLLDPEPIKSMIVIVVALIGVGINFGTAMLFFKDRDSDLNIRASFMHLAADALVSLGVVISGVIMLYTGLVWIDAIAGITIAIVIIIGTWGILNESVIAVLDAVPKSINFKQVEKYFLSLKGVTTLHDLRIWAVSTRHIALTVHLTMPKDTLDDKALLKVQKHLKAEFKIDYITIQVEKKSENLTCHYAH